MTVLEGAIDIVGIAPLLRESLADGALAVGEACIAGERLDVAASGKRFAVTDPATGEVLASLPDCGQFETRRAIAAAERAQSKWKAWTGKEKAAVLRKVHDLMLAHLDDLALILTREMGKPLAEARGEVRYGAAYFEWFAEEAKRVYGDTIPGHERDKRIVVLRQPVGVVAAITPWNFPNAMLARKIAPALAAGCAVVCKPAAQTPLSALAIAELADRAGLPPALLSVIPGTDAAAIGAEMCDNPTVRKITFTGSTRVGAELMRSSAHQIKKLSLELGGNAPFIVFDDADLDKAVEGAIAAKFRNAGQTCVCANRIYVQSGIYDAFAESMARAVAALNVGNGLADNVQIGPLIEPQAVAKVETHVADALAKGATVMTGGARSDQGSLFFKPTVLSGADDTMLVAREETFGPLAPLFRFETEEEVVAAANFSEFGLAGYFFSRDLSRVWRVAEALECGIVGINTGQVSTEVAPFGGVKQSGLGREGSKYGLEDYTELKYLCLAL